MHVTKRDIEDQKLLKKILNRYGISFEIGYKRVEFYLPGRFLFEDAHPICYEIAFKYKMRRSRNTRGFINEDFVLNPIMCTSDRTLCMFMRRCK